jgi:hypothetical protein
MHDGKMGTLGTAMPTAAWLLAAMAFGWGVSVVALLGCQRGALLALFSKQAVLEVFYLRLLQSNLLLKRLYPGFCSGMLYFPIARPMA